MNQHKPGVTRELVYNFLESWLMEKGYAPTVREIGEGVGLKSTNTVHAHLETLRAQGRVQGRGRTLRSVRRVA